MLPCIVPYRVSKEFLGLPELQELRGYLVGREVSVDLDLTETWYIIILHKCYCNTCMYVRTYMYSITV